MYVHVWVHACVSACVNACVCASIVMWSSQFEGSDRAQTVDVHCSGNVTAQGRHA